MLKRSRKTRAVCCAIHFSLDADVHQSDLRRIFFGLRDGIGAIGDGRGYAVSQIGQDVAQIFGGDPLILDNQNTCRHAVFRPILSGGRPFRSIGHDYTCDSSSRVVRRAGAAQPAMTLLACRAWFGSLATPVRSRSQDRR